MLLTLILEQCGFVYIENQKQFWKEENDYIITVTCWYNNYFAISLKSQSNLISAYSQTYEINQAQNGNIITKVSGRSIVYTRAFLNIEENTILNYTEMETVVTRSLSNADRVWKIIHEKGPFAYFVWNLFTNQIKYSKLTNIKNGMCEVIE